ncbi:multidrug resistance protein 1-like isoform X2 [Cimex lectularius]|uniref:ABC Transporter n=1 Tax=Cimex lectularius TaxID=79782 RepID=A0A8I6TDV6_CIMLE|nr:multidrug resistance protein 1-like isoform X2 [Cimex lectularius]
MTFQLKSKDEESLLIKPENVINYGALPRFSSTKREKPITGIRGLFRYATNRDYIYLIFGTLFAFIQGASVPCLGYVFGIMSDTFLEKSVNTQIDDILDNLYSKINHNRSFHSSALKSYVNEMNISEKDGFMKSVIIFCTIYIFLGTISFLSTFFQVFLFEKVADRQLFRLRKNFFSQVLRQNIDWFESSNHGDFTSNISDDIERIRDGIGYKLSMIIVYVSIFVSGCILSLLLNWKLTCVILALAPLIIISSGYMARFLSTGAVREQLRYSDAGSVAEEVFTCLKTVISFGTIEFEAKRYEKALEEGRRVSLKKYYLLASFVLFFYIIMHSSYGFGFWYGSVLISTNEATIGEVFGVLFCMLSSAFSFGSILPYINSVLLAKGSGEIIQEIINRVPPIDPLSTYGIKPVKFSGKLSFEKVCFRYSTRQTVQVLNRINLEINPGKIVAIVGESGSGKSTIVNLLLRYYDATEGRITFDGIDIRDINIKWLRSKIGVVSQEPVLFGVSIEDNIRYGRKEVTKEEIISAAKLANAHSFIKKLPQGYHTMVGERGAQLSGGQKQRIAIARALIRDPTFLLLDEATSALDSESESVVHEALNKAMEGRTTLIIAHRLSTIRNANKIYVMNKGEIMESGTHSELMELKGAYYKFVSIQSITNEEIPQLEDVNLIQMNSPKQISTVDDSLKTDRNTKDISMTQCFLRLGLLNLPEWNWLLLGFFACFVLGSTPCAFAFLYSEMVFNLTGDELTETILFWSLMFVALGVFSGLFYYAKIISMSTAAENLVVRLRNLCFRNILRQEMSWFDNENNSCSVLLTQLSRDAPYIKAASGLRVGQLITAFVTMACGIAISLFFGWKMGLLLIIISPALIYSGFKHMSLVRKSQLEDLKALDKAGKITGECFRNIKTVQALAQEELFINRYISCLVERLKEAGKKAFWFSLTYAFAQSTIFIMYSVAFGFGGYLVISNQMDINNVFRVFFSITFCATAIGQGIATLQDFSKAKIAAMSIFKLIERKSLIDPLSLEGIRKEIHGKIEFRNITFIYPSRPHVVILSNFNLKIEVNQTLALVGTSGCGKSTVINLLEQFYLPIAGKILIDNIDIKNMNTEFLRSQIGLVTQEPLLFNCTIKENIIYGSKVCGCIPSEFDMYNATKLANIHEFISSLPQGYDTICGTLGTQLSGGQKQRIVIARALIRNPKILLLDEATSALDSKSEEVVQQALDQARIGRTTIVIAHRLSTIKNADVIAVLHKGQIVELGNHKDLLKKQGLYFNLVKHQV